jgi:hypothetical protein
MHTHDPTQKHPPIYALLCITQLREIFAPLDAPQSIPIAQAMQCAATPHMLRKPTSASGRWHNGSASKK